VDSVFQARRLQGVHAGVVSGVLQAFVNEIDILCQRQPNVHAERYAINSAKTPCSYTPYYRPPPQPLPRLFENPMSALRKCLQK
jgi:hypothetical protein